MPQLSLASPKVVAEVIDGEAIILDLRVGTYFATPGVGAAVWSAAIEGWTTAAIVDSAAAFYADQPAAGPDVAALLDRLVGADLLKVVEEDDRHPRSNPGWPSVYATPILEKHDDLQDMMQLDPIHDTDATGWPMPAPDPRT